MSKVQPLFNNDGEIRATEAYIKEFAFDEIRTSPKFTALISGPEGVGKTHLACTMTEVGPVYVVDTENKADIVTRKFDPKIVKHKVVSNWLGLVAVVQAILKTQAPGTIVIDSGTDVQVFAEIAYLERTKQEKVYPLFNWSEVHAMCNALIKSIRYSEHNLVMTSRIKEQYVGDKGTGVYIPRIYSNIPHMCDFGVQFDKGTKPGYLTKNGYKNDMTVQIPRNLTLSQIQSLLSKE